MRTLEVPGSDFLITLRRVIEMKTKKKINKWGWGILAAIAALIVMFFGFGVDDVPIEKTPNVPLKEMEDKPIEDPFSYRLDEVFAAQSWNATDSSTGHQTDHLDYGYNRDLSLQSNFSGTTCPGSPVEGQHCYDTDDDILYIRDESAWNEVFPGPSLSSPTFGGTITGTYTLDGVITIDDPTLSGSFQGDVSSTGLFKSSQSCPTINSHTFTRVGNICYDSDGALNQIAFVNADESTVQTRTIDSSVRMAIIRVMARLGQDGTGETGTAGACTWPGDASPSAVCTGPDNSVLVYAYLADEESINTSTIITKTDTSGQIKTLCDVTNGTGVAVSCWWYLVGYLDN